MDLEPEDFARLSKLPSRKLWAIIYAYSIVGLLGTTALRLLPLMEERVKKDVIITQILLGTAIVHFIAGAFLQRIGDTFWVPHLIAFVSLRGGKFLKYFGAFFVLLSTLTAPLEGVFEYFVLKLLGVHG